MTMVLPAGEILPFAPAEELIVMVAIKVVTENGVVYLMGSISPQQGDLASQVTRQVDGVQKVVTLFEYTN